VRNGRRVEVLDAAVGPVGVVATGMLTDDVKDVPSERPAPEPRRPEYRVLASRDTTTWSDDSFADLAGTRVAPGQVTMAGDHVVVTGTTLDGKTAPAPARTVAVVGTPE
jgi:hypothetical protein